MKNFNWQHTLGPGIIYISIIMHLPWQQCTIRVQHPTTTKQCLFKTRKKKSLLSTGLITFALTRLDFGKIRDFARFVPQRCIACFLIEGVGGWSVQENRGATLPSPQIYRNCSKEWRITQGSGAVSAAMCCAGTLGIIKVIFPVFSQCECPVSSIRKQECWNCITMSWPEPVEGLKFSPQHLLEHLWSPQSCAFTSSHRWFTPLNNSLPWLRSLLQIHSQPFTAKLRITVSLVL